MVKYLYKLTNTPCPNCGLHLPNLDACRLAGTCIICARIILKEKCNACEDKNVCDILYEGLIFYKNLEERASDVIVDISRLLESEISKVFRKLELKVDDYIVEMLTRIYLSAIALLIKMRGNITKWIISILSPETIKLIPKMSIDIIDVDERLKLALRELLMRFEVRSDEIIEPVINVLKLLLVIYVRAKLELKSDHLAVSRFLKALNKSFTKYLMTRNV
ncbi:MAG: hypothetical protein B6V02_00810 [Thermoprotei archaeon ex4572_64]|nr:MAG: hypothetical protein B6V02_00810 [Thermoprotei archaeon ex4572_64]